MVGFGARSVSVAAKPRPSRTVVRVADVLIVTGPVGAGKTSVAFECLEVLEEHGIAAAMVDGDRPVQEIALAVLGRAGWIASVHPDR